MRAVWMAGLAVVLAVAGCRWFDTRDPLPGEPETPVPWQSPTEPEIVLANMDSALIYLGRGIDNYQRCLGDTFHFYPLDDDRATLEAQGKPNAYDDWDREVEREVMDLVLNSAKSVDLTFSDQEVIADEPEFKKWEEHYLLVIEWLSGETGVYEGNCQMEIRIDPEQANQWFIEKWGDVETPGQEHETWGRLRGEKRQI